MDTNVAKFMNALGECCDKENYLSDITYALCESNQAFRQFFLDYFFGEMKLDAQQVDITREYRFEGYRPDFVIERREPRDFFIVEVKINDRNHHFKDYETALGKIYKENCPSICQYQGNLKDHIGYIANYQITPNETKEAKGFNHVRTWRDFYAKLDGVHWLNDKAVEGYGQLCKDVCGFVDITRYTIDLQDFALIQKSQEWIENLFDNNDKVRPYDGYYQQACQKNWRIGRYFEVVNYRGRKKGVFGWIGVYLVDKGAQFVVAFEDRKGWGDLVCRDLKKIAHDDFTIEYDDKWDRSLYFYMNHKPGGFNEENVKDFFRRVIQCIEGAHEAFPCEKHNLVKCNGWLAMVKLPALIKAELFKGWSFGCYEVSFCGSGVNAYEYAQNVKSSCIEWFKMSLNQHGSRAKKEVWGFVGVVWGKSKWIGADVFRRTKGKPMFVVSVFNLGKKERAAARAHHWIEQKDTAEKAWVCKIREGDLAQSETLRNKFVSVLKTILP